MNSKVIDVCTYKFITKHNSGREEPVRQDRRVPIFENFDNNFDQTFTFNHLSLKLVNEICVCDQCKLKLQYFNYFLITTTVNHLFESYCPQGTANIIPTELPEFDLPGL